VTPAEPRPEQLLCHLLDELNEAFVVTSKQPISIEFERERYIVGLLAIARFLDRIAILDQHAQKFVDLATLLNDVALGILPSLFTPAYGSKMDESHLWLGRAYAVLGVEAFAAQQPGKKAAAVLYVEKNFPKIRKLATNRKSLFSSLGTTLSGWTKEFKKGTIKNPLAKSAFETGLFSLKEYQKSEMSDLSLAEIADNYFAGAAKIADGICQ
jgi:hypothetical protein